MLRLIAAFALTLISASAAFADCNAYKARDFDIRLVEDERSLTVSWERYSQKLDKVVTKPWGVLQDAAVNMEEPGQPAHLIMREKVDGKDAIIFDSIVFLPECQ
jgi:uncharacterized membrane protein